MADDKNRRSIAGKHQPGWHFKLMALTYRFRDALLPRERIFEEAGIKPGMRVLDYGCGPGSYVSVAAKLVGESGMVYALDSHPLAIESVRRTIAGRRLRNVRTVLSGCEMWLPDGALDAVLLYDVLHDLGEPTRVLREIHRVLKADGVLSVSDHHLSEVEIIARLTDDSLFSLLRRGKRTCTLSPVVR